MPIRMFTSADAEPVSRLVGRNFLEVNSRDYPLENMQALAEIYTPDKMLQTASFAHTYVAVEDGVIAGTGTICPYWGSETESILLTIFVLPEYHGRGIGRDIVRALEADEFFLRANRVEVPASITACVFYEKMGYQYKDGTKQLDSEGHYRMEKFRTC